MDGNSMEDIKNMVQLEAAVDKLLNAINEMRQEKLVLEARLESKDQDIVTLKQQLQMLHGERSQIDQRVTGLLGSIEKWEKLNESTDVVDESEVAIEEKTLF